MGLQVARQGLGELVQRRTDEVCDRGPLSEFQPQRVARQGEEGREDVRALVCDPCAGWACGVQESPPGRERALQRRERGGVVSARGGVEAELGEDDQAARGQEDCLLRGPRRTRRSYRGPVEH